MLSQSSNSQNTLNLDFDKIVNACFVCHKKLGLHKFLCDCDTTKLYCSNHMNDHECTINYKDMKRDLLIKTNPVIKGNKFSSHADII